MKLVKVKYDYTKMWKKIEQDTDTKITFEVWWGILVKILPQVKDQVRDNVAGAGENIW